jgi:CubicO group peptidase (beta-lactamase class C family)
MLKIGQLYLQDGIWNDARIVPHDWVAASAATYLPVPGWDAHWGYSYGWWPQDQRYGHGAFAASGWGQQAIIVMPELDMVAVFTGGSYWETPPLTWHQMMIGYVLPAVVATPVASKAGKSN